MKKFLAVFILLCVWLMPQFAKALDESKICYRYTGNKAELTQILVKYFTEDIEDTYEYFIDKIQESLESDGVGSVTCRDLINVCIKAEFSEDKCEAFYDELNPSLKRVSNENEQETVRLTNDPCDGLNENVMQTLCESYNNTLKNAPAQRGNVYGLESGARGECYRKYGYELGLGGCRKKK